MRVHETLLDEAGLDAWRAFLESHAAITRRIDAELAAAGLPPLTWYDVLYSLYEAEGRRLRMSGLADEVVLLSRTGLTRLVDRMEAAGAVRREAVPGDRRGTWVVLTVDGVRLLRRIWRAYGPVLAERWRPPLGRDARAVARALERVRAAAATP